MLITNIYVIYVQEKILEEHLTVSACVYMLDRGLIETFHYPGYTFLKYWKKIFFKQLYTAFVEGKNKMENKGRHNSVSNSNV